MQRERRGVIPAPQPTKTYHIEHPLEFEAQLAASPSPPRIAVDTQTQKWHDQSSLFNPIAFNIDEKVNEKDDFKLL